MNNKGLLYNMSGWAQFSFFFFIFVCGYILTVTMLVSFFDMEEINQSAHEMRMAMTIQSVCLFLFPSLVFTYLCQESPKNYLKVESESNYSLALLLLSIILIVVIQPTIFALSFYNQQMVFPESLSSIENWMREAELNAEKSLTLLFVDKSVIGLVFNLLVLAVVAGLAEELFFRGCLQQIVQKIVINKHVAVWVTAFIFSAIHLQFYGFIPRLLLGALLGYLFIWSGNIWIPVIVHSVHNAINVILTHIYKETSVYEQIENYRFEDNILIILPSLILTIAILYAVHRKSYQQNQSIKI